MARRCSAICTAALARADGIWHSAGRHGITVPIRLARCAQALLADARHDAPSPRIPTGTVDAGDARVLVLAVGRRLPESAADRHPSRLAEAMSEMLLVVIDRDAVSTEALSAVNDAADALVDGASRRRQRRVASHARMLTRRVPLPVQSLRWHRCLPMRPVVARLSKWQPDESAVRCCCCCRVHHNGCATAASSLQRLAAAEVRGIWHSCYCYDRNYYW